MPEQKFCPFTSVYDIGPAGSWVKKLAPCDPANCGIVSRGANVCPFSYLPDIEQQLRAFNAIVLALDKIFIKGAPDEQQQP